jgi:hypothetical protein
MIDSIDHVRADGSYVATVNALPYHIVPSDPLFAQAQAMAAQAGDLPPEPPPASISQIQPE